MPQSQERNASHPSIGHDSNFCGPQVRNASSKRDVTTLRRFSSGSYKPRQLGSLHIEGRRRSTSKPSVLSTDQTISEIGSRILPDEKSLLDGRFILESNISRI